MDSYGLIVFFFEFRLNGLRTIRLEDNQARYIVTISVASFVSCLDHAMTNPHSVR